MSNIENKQEEKQQEEEFEYFFSCPSCDEYYTTNGDLCIMCTKKYEYKRIKPTPIVLKDIPINTNRKNKKYISEPEPWIAEEYLKNKETNIKKYRQLKINKYLYYKNGQIKLPYIKKGPEDTQIYKFVDTKRLSITRKKIPIDWQEDYSLKVKNPINVPFLKK